MTTPSRCPRTRQPCTFASMPAALAGAVAERAHAVASGSDIEDSLAYLVLMLRDESAYLQSVLSALMAEALDVALARIEAGGGA